VAEKSDSEYLNTLERGLRVMRSFSGTSPEIMQDNPTGRTGPRIRCIGRTDDMLIVRGVNFFPTALRSILEKHAASVSGMFQVRPVSKGVSQPAQIPISIELGQGMSAPPVDLANAIQAEIRERLLVTADINLVSFGSVPRATYKSKLVDYSDAS